MRESEDTLARVEHLLDRGQMVISRGAAHAVDSYDWLFIAGNLVSAAELLATVPADEGGPQRTLFAEVLEELREMTNNFQLPAFLSASRAARRDNPALFRSHRRPPTAP